MRENLYDLFLAARRSCEDPRTNSWTADWIWIDQICIDQTDVEERCHQVGQMTELYSSAKATIIWPGLLPEMLPNVQPCQECLKEISFWDARGVFSEEVSKPREQCGEISLKRLAGQSLTELMTKPCWERLWVARGHACVSISCVSHITYGRDSPSDACAIHDLGECA